MSYNIVSLYVAALLKTLPAKLIIVSAIPSHSLRRSSPSGFHSSEYIFLQPHNLKAKAVPKPTEGILNINAGSVPHSVKRLAEVPAKNCVPNPVVDIQSWFKTSCLKGLKTRLHPHKLAISVTKNLLENQLLFLYYNVLRLWKWNRELM